MAIHLTGDDADALIVVTICDRNSVYHAQRIEVPGAMPVPRIDQARMLRALAGAIEESAPPEATGGTA